MSKQDHPDIERYHNDVWFRVFWDAARQHVGHLWDMRMQGDEPEVLELRDMLVEAHEAGARRSLQQMARGEAALADHARWKANLPLTVVLERTDTTPKEDR